MNSLWRGDIVKGYEANTRTYESSVEVAWEFEAAQKSCAPREAWSLQREISSVIGVMTDLKWL